MANVEITRPEMEQRVATAFPEFEVVNFVTRWDQDKQIIDLVLKAKPEEEEVAEEAAEETS